MTDAVKIDVWSDVACPWCYIGKRKFEAGAAASGVPVEVEYHSFELSPDTPVDFEGSAIEFLSGHKGIPVEQAKAMTDQVSAIAAEVGLDYHYDDIRHTKTLLAHELLHLAKSRGRQLETAEALFKAYFVDGRHVGHVDDLVALAESVGLDGAEARAALEDHRFAGDVQADLAQAVAYGIRGVPFFVIDGRYGVSGAQAPEVFAGALAQVAAEQAAAR
ncbi:DsbA family oxidoreductase [Amnibacterium setariae]|uniref:DsbA family oxidoreductase n=1 Tax=Amnibacterium setariae TaxID=2306585 RepID=A0A3A1TVA3_9MICO|nr:DsbA family oxidoreductase [Amnibacterium setariae]RIX28162.1 DsbA family oxidoreductase [Amnibacterium setariae]